MTANRVETGTKEERMTIKSKRGGGGAKNITEPYKGRGGSSKFYRDTNKILRAPLPPQVIKLTSP